MNRSGVRSGIIYTLMATRMQKELLCSSASKCEHSVESFNYHPTGIQMDVVHCRAALLLCCIWKDVMIEKWKALQKTFVA